MAKFRVWARSTYAKVRAWFRDTWNSVAQFFTRLWSFFLTHWKWGAGLVVVLGVLYGRETIAKAVGYTTPLIEITGMSPGVRFFRDLMLGVVALIGLYIAWLRATALDSQSKTATEEFALAQNRLLSDRFATAAELMGRENRAGEPAIASRISGIYIMESLARDAADKFAEQVVKNLIAYIKDYAQITATSQLKKDKQTIQLRMLGDDVKVAFMVLHNILDDKAIRCHTNSDIVDFSHQDFSGLVLDASTVQLKHCKNWAATKFIGASLHETNFVRANLTGADFSNTELHKTKLERADMSYAHFNGATLESADLRDAVLREVKMRNIILRDVDLRGANFERADLTDAKTFRARMQGCHLSNAILERSCLQNAHLEGADLTQASLEDADMQNACLQGALLEKAKLRGAKLLGAQFRDTCLSGADLDDDLPDQVLSSMDKKVWFLSDEQWAQKINMRPRHSWELEKYWDGYALAGVLDNFAGAYGHGFPNIPAPVDKEFESIREAAVALLFDYDHRLPSNMPENWRAWVEEIDPATNMHPDDIDEEDDEDD